MTGGLSGLVLPYRGIRPTIARSAYVAPTAVVAGDVVIGEDCGIWFGCILRGDTDVIRIGNRTNIQDGTVLHTSSSGLATLLGDEVTVGHMALLHACTIESGAFIGMKACVMDGAVVESGAMVAAGALVPPGKRVPRGEIWAGSPARRLRTLREDELRGFRETIERYVDLARAYREGGESLLSPNV